MYWSTVSKQSASMDINHQALHQATPPTCTPVLILQSATDQVLLKALGSHAELNMPLVSLRTPAGFPSPASDFECDRVDLLERLSLDKPYVFMAKVRGHSMTERGIDDGDLLVINRKITPRHGHIVVAVIDNELTCKTLFCQNEVVKLVAANPDFKDIELRDSQELTIWGVVTSCIKSFGE